VRTAWAAPARARSRAAGAVAGCGLVVLLLVGAGSLDTLVTPDLGPGFAVTSQGPLSAALFAANAPDRAAATGALSMPVTSISTSEQVGQADGGHTLVQDPLVRFPGAGRARVFPQAAQHSRASDADAQPSSPAGAARAARAQPAAKKGPSAAAIGAAAFVGAVLALALVTPLVLRRRRPQQEEAAGTAVLPASPSGGDAGDDLREGSR
jgi:hypothetical protein